VEPTALVLLEEASALAPSKWYADLSITLYISNEGRLVVNYILPKIKTDCLC
jgi:hypothetical protein